MTIPDKHINNIIVISASSDIGYYLTEQWLREGKRVIGTYRIYNKNMDKLKAGGAELMQCDLSNRKSINQLTCAIREWDTLVLCPGDMDPIGMFEQVDFGEWRSSIEVNFTAQLEIVHKLLPMRNKNIINGPLIIFFAGGGTNNATVNYSAYTVSKIALIKMVELLDAEIIDTRFSIIGPGWVKTKIHDQTLRSGDRAGANYEKTVEKMISGEFTELEKIHACCNWILSSERCTVSGRNFSVAFDKWGTPELTQALIDDKDMYKLRRYKN